MAKPIRLPNSTEQQVLNELTLRPADPEVAPRAKELIRQPPLPQNRLLGRGSTLLGGRT